MTRERERHSPVQRMVWTLVVVGIGAGAVLTVFQYGQGRVLTRKHGALTQQAGRLDDLKASILQHVRERTDCIEHVLYGDNRDDSLRYVERLEILSGEVETLLQEARGWAERIDAGDALTRLHDENQACLELQESVLDTWNERMFILDHTDQLVSTIDVSARRFVEALHGLEGRVRLQHALAKRRFRESIEGGASQGELLEQANGIILGPATKVSGYASELTRQAMICSEITQAFRLIHDKDRLADVRDNRLSPALHRMRMLFSQFVDDTRDIPNLGDRLADAQTAKDVLLDSLLGVGWTFDDRSLHVRSTGEGFYDFWSRNIELQEATPRLVANLDAVDKAMTSALEDMAASFDSFAARQERQFQASVRDGAVLSLAVLGGTLSILGFTVSRYTARIREREREDERKLRDSEERLQTILDTTRAGIVIIDAESHKIVQANPVAIKLIGTTKEEMIGKVCNRLYCPGDSRGCPISTGGGEGEAAERTLITSDGREIPILKTIVPVMLNGRKCLIESFLDITDRKIAEAAFQQEKQFSDDIINSLPGVFLVLLMCEGYSRIVRWNRKAQDVMGKSVRQLSGMCPDVLFQGEDRRIFQESVRRAFINGEDDTEACIRNDEGDSRPFYWTTLSTIVGGQTYLICFGVDVTERKRLQSQLLQAQKLDSIGELAAGIAHEINTPTQYIGDNTRFVQKGFAGLAKVLESYGKLLDAAKNNSISTELIEDVQQKAEQARVDFMCEEIPEAVSEALEGVERVTEIVSAIRAFSHPGVEGRSDIDVNKAIAGTITVARSEWKYVADLETDFDENLPPVRGMVGELNQAILNILVNAAHAVGDVVGDGSHGKGTIRVSTRQCDDWVEIRISDTGGGIPEEVQGRIFDPFFTTKDVGIGTGQGLAISHTIVTQSHRGTISFETGPEQGTTFIIRLPVSGSHDEAEDQEGVVHAW